MTDISRHPLLQQAFEVCQAIEACGASVELTDAVTKASALLAALDKFIPIGIGKYPTGEIQITCDARSKQIGEWPNRWVDKLPVGGK